jgi:hypothetical protein
MKVSSELSTNDSDTQGVHQGLLLRTQIVNSFSHVFIRFKGVFYKIIISSRFVKPKIDLCAPGKCPPPLKKAFPFHSSLFFDLYEKLAPTRSPKPLSDYPLPPRTDLTFIPAKNLGKARKFFLTSFSKFE